MLAVRFDNWKVVFWEQRARGTLQIWAEPFVPLRVLKLLRADVTSNTYYDWLLDNDHVILAAQLIMSRYLQTVMECPPRQKAASSTRTRMWPSWKRP